MPAPTQLSYISHDHRALHSDLPSQLFSSPTPIPGPLSFFRIRPIDIGGQRDSDRGLALQPYRAFRVR